MMAQRYIFFVGLLLVRFKYQVSGGGGGRSIRVGATAVARAVAAARLRSFWWLCLHRSHPAERNPGSRGPAGIRKVYPTAKKEKCLFFSQFFSCLTSNNLKPPRRPKKKTLKKQSPYHPPFFLLRCVHSQTRNAKRAHAPRTRCCRDSFPIGPGSAWCSLSLACCVEFSAVLALGISGMGG